jgi:translation initiation factor 2 beta subunit (eIF-2beta)/eIF-5
MSEQPISAQIQQIYSDSSLSANEKSRKVQQLLSNNWLQKQSSSDESKDSEKSFHKGDILGCKHYQRKCKIQANCCEKFFVCRLCHDEQVLSHKIDRYATQNMLCMNCGTIQSVNQNCVACNDTMATYYCNICKFFDNSPNATVYHCDKCGLCRRGKGLGIDFQHCDNCNACIGMSNLDTHVCIEKILESNCPICLEWMHNSVSPPMFLKCGHPMHVKCFEKFARSSFRCPTCLKAAGDMRDQDHVIEEYVNAIEIPEHYKNDKALILCNECLKKSQVKYHFAYHKCPECSSYNTDILKVIKG